jgi:hypothetical protein
MIVKMPGKTRGRRKKAGKPREKSRKGAERAVNDKARSIT